MKMKVLLAYLSLVAFVQVLLVTFGGSLVIEFYKDEPSKGRLLLSSMITTVLFMIVVVIYCKVFFNASKQKR